MDWQAVQFDINGRHVETGEEHINRTWLTRTSVVVFLIAIVGTSVLIVAGLAFYKQAVLMQTVNNLKRIGLALDQYHHQYGSFPPVRIHGRNHGDMHSWRAIIQSQLTPINESGTRSLTYDFSLPWHQQQKWQSDLTHQLDTNPYQFLAVVGPKAAWADDRTRSVSDFEDGTSNTILLIAIRNTGIRWHEPQDISVKGTTLFLGDRPLDLTADVFVLMADGSTRYFATGIDHQHLAPMLTIADRDRIPEW